MYTLIRERVASMYELTYVYNLDEMLKLYDPVHPEQSSFAPPY